jgi:murein DD-endopeptidase
MPGDAFNSQGCGSAWWQRRLSMSIGAVVLLTALSGCATLPPRPLDQGVALRIVEKAKSLLGIPYRYGGTTSNGFDCSGFTQYVFLQAAGIRLPRTARDQFAFARPISLGEEKPADLLFYKINGRDISHVAIYLGQGKFIHSSHEGGSVTIVKANDRYWRKRLAGVRRVNR